MKLTRPTRFRGLPCDFRPPPLADACCSRLSTHAPERYRGGVLAVVRDHVLDLPRRDLGDHDGAGVHVGGAFLAFWSSGHHGSVMLSGKLRKRGECGVFDQLKYYVQWMILRILLFNILIGGVGILLILYELIADQAAIRAAQLDKLADFFGALMTFVGVIVTAASIYFYTDKTTKPSPEARWGTAPIVIVGCLICIYFLFSKGGVPAHIVNGFALLGISGGLKRIQPNPQKAASMSPQLN